PAFWTVPYFDLSSVLHDDFLHHRQSQSCSIAFGGEKWSKQFRHRRLRNPGPIISNHNALPSSVLALNDLPAKGHAPAAPGSRTCFGGIPGQIQQRLPQQPLVACHAVEIPCPFDGYLRHRLSYLSYGALHNLFQFYAVQIG